MPDSLSAETHTPVSKHLYAAAVVAGLLIAVLVIAALDQPGHTPDTTPVAAAATPAAEPMTTAPITTTTTPVDTRKPEEIQVDNAATSAGITQMPYGVTYPHELVTDVCNTMRHATPELPAADWLSRNLVGSPNYVQLYQIGFPALCPEFTPTLDAILTGTASFDSGTREVGAAQGKVAPGQWRTTTAVSDCYWERTSPSGDILDNQFATHATAGGITVTIRPSDGSFTTHECGLWQRVG